MQTPLHPLILTKLIISFFQNDYISLKYVKIDVCFVLFYDHTLTLPNRWPHGYAFDIVQKPLTRQCACLLSNYQSKSHLEWFWHWKLINYNLYFLKSQLKFWKVVSLRDLGAILIGKIYPLEPWRQQQHKGPLVYMELHPKFARTW
jgi:hypothetical protein